MSSSAAGTGPPADRHLARLARRGTASVLGAGVSAVAGVGLVVVVTNGFSPTVAGTLFAATSAFLILEAVALLGVDTGLVRWLPDQLATGRGRDLRRTLAVSAVPVLGVSLVLSTVLLVAAPAIAPHLVGSQSAPTMTTMLRALALALPVAALHDLVLAGTRGVGTMRPTVMVENIGRLGLQALAVLAVFLLGGGPLSLAIAWAAPYLVGLALAGAWLRGLLGRATSRADHALAPTPWRVLVREFWGYTAPRAIARITQTGLKRSDIVLVAALASPTDAALYAAATRLIVLGQLFVQSVQQALAPHLSSLFAKGDIDSAERLFQTCTRWSVVAAWPLYLILAGFAPLLMGVFGDGYGQASDVVLVLSLTMLLATACGPVDSVLLMAGRSWLSLRNSSIALTVNLGLNVLLIPAAGIRGAAIAWSVSIVVRNLLPLGQVRRHLGLSPVTPATVRVGVSALCWFGSVDALVLILDPVPPVAASALVVATLGYLTGVWRWRVALGLEAFRSVLRPRRTTVSAAGSCSGRAMTDAPPGPDLRAGTVAASAHPPHGGRPEHPATPVAPETSGRGAPPDQEALRAPID